MIVQMASCLIWTGTRSGMIIAYPNYVCIEIDHIQKNIEIGSKFKMKLFKCFKKRSFDGSIISLVKILHYAQKLEKDNRTVIIEEKITNKLQKRKLKINDEDEDNFDFDHVDLVSRNICLDLERVNQIKVIDLEK
ncbi:hypothetical protein RFI_26427 [Reticulomyxa filosa]|uniref:Uncharacterized protein n=1 Tax=Reticulomyxa filosa TaxID=46433 RepID=X6MD41_RETFI|nr:hypothetical protein RFI_26427 [Reticulomyxa filosa]|eukprot:ETO10945.1 hypothetical protein RFI_26427 [Reticulomyxa filosa]